jgi:hypothetical protein
MYQYQYPLFPCVNFLSDGAVQWDSNTGSRALWNGVDGGADKGY